MGNRIGGERPDPTVSHEAEAADAEGSVTACRDGAVLRVTLDRPLRRNSLTQLMIETLVDALTDAAADDSLRAIHIRGAGDDFCAGADWVAANSAGGQRPRPGDLVRRIPHAAHRVIELVHSIQLPVVCSVQGWAVGMGCNLALAADFTVAAHRRRVLGAVRGPWLQPGFGLYLATAPAGRPGPGPANAAARRESDRDGCGRLGIDPPSRKPARTRRHGRGAAGTTGLWTNGSDRTGQTGAELRSARVTEPIDDTGTFQPGTILSDKRFQRGSGSLSATTRTEFPWPMTP